MLSSVLPAFTLTCNKLQHYQLYQSCVWPSCSCSHIISQRYQNIMIQASDGLQALSALSIPKTMNSCRRSDNSRQTNGEQKKNLNLMLLCYSFIKQQSAGTNTPKTASLMIHLLLALDNMHLLIYQCVLFVCTVNTIDRWSTAHMWNVQRTLEGSRITRSLRYPFRSIILKALVPTHYNASLNY